MPLEQLYLQFWEDVENGSFKIALWSGICKNFNMFLRSKKKSSLTPIRSRVFLKSYHKSWDKSTEYGKLRWELFDFIKDECLNALNKGD